MNVFGHRFHLHRRATCLDCEQWKPILLTEYECTIPIITVPCTCVKDADWVCDCDVWIRYIEPKSQYVDMIP